MRKNTHYVVAIMNLHAGELTQLNVYAKDEVTAANAVLSTEFGSMGEVHAYCANCDYWISVHPINNTLTE